jgi:PPOX class probable FMN-dependent enzyme
VRADGDPYRVHDLSALQALLGPVGEASVRKEVAFLHPVYRRLIEASPFVLLATNGERGLDVSPRGDPPGFVQIVDEKTLLLPERRGNNRADSLRNLLVDPRIALQLFLIPGVGETLRVNGTAHISTAPDLMQRCAHEHTLPKCVIVVDVATAFFQCARAVRRSQLWSMTADAARGVPSAGAMLAALSDGGIGGEAYDHDLAARQNASLY